MRLGITMFATDRTMPPHELAVAALAIKEVVLRLPSGPREQVLPALDSYAKTYLR